MAIDEWAPDFGPENSEHERRLLNAPIDWRAFVLEIRLLRCAENLPLLLVLTKTGCERLANVVYQNIVGNSAWLTRARKNDMTRKQLDGGEHSHCYPVDRADYDRLTG